MEGGVVIIGVLVEFYGGGRVGRSFLGFGCGVRR